MIVLGLDTSTLSAGVALWETSGSRILARRQCVVTKHSDLLLTLVDQVLKEAGLTPPALDGVVCGAGPGSFTGLRIGLATAKGLCFALDRPLLLVSSLAALAARAPDGLVCATLDAHKGEVYAALFSVSEGRPQLDPQLEGTEWVLPPAELASKLATLEHPFTLVGEGALRYRQLVLPTATLLDEEGAPRPSDLARLGAERLLRGEHDDLAHSTPRYVRASEAELLKRKSDENRS